EPVAARLHRAHDGPRRVEAPKPLEPVDDLAPPLAIHDRDQVQDPRGRVRLVPLVLLLEQLPQRPLDRARGGALRAPNAGRLEPGHGWHLTTASTCRRPRGARRPLRAPTIRPGTGAAGPAPVTTP